MKAREDRSAQIRGFFDRLAVGRDESIEADALVSYEQNTRHAAVRSLLSLDPGSHVLDIGCGNARDLSQLGSMYPETKFLGIDFSPEMVSQGNAALRSLGLDKVELRVGDVTELQLPNGSYDWVICSEVLEHIPDFSRAVSEIERVLRPGGKAVITVPNRRSMYGVDRHIHRWVLKRRGRDEDHPYDEWKTYRELAGEFEQNGFQILRRAGVCYTPGFLIPSRLPGAGRRALVRVVSLAEPVLSKVAPSLGYMIAALFRKPDGDDSR